jgi:hypothetical protein
LTISLKIVIFLKKLEFKNGRKVMLKPKPIIDDRIRNIRDCTFGWVDHNFLHKGFLNRLSPQELLLYYFLITVADRNGVSFYDYERICQFLKLEVDNYLTARNRLCERSLIAFENSVFQVLSLPKASSQKVATPILVNRPLHNEVQSLEEIFKSLADQS